MMRHPPTPRCLVFILLLAMLACHVFAKDKKDAPSPALATQEKMEVMLYRVPLSFISVSPKTDVPKYVVPVDKSNGIYDITGFLKDSGITFPPGSEALYFSNLNTIYVRNTREMLDLVDMIADSGHPCGLPAIMIKAELSALECSLPAEAMAPETKQLSYGELTRLAGKSMKLIDRLTLVTKSGQRAEGTHLANPAVNSTAAISGTSGNTVDDVFHQPFVTGETGTKAELEPIIGPDGETMDFNIVYRFQQAAGLHPGQPATAITFTTSFTTRDEIPLVLNISPEPGREGKFLAIVIRPQIILTSGRTIKEEAEAMKQKVKQMEAASHRH